jgi:predicted DCC family thiol-disulfide oxidoreductase YuxK
MEPGQLKLLYDGNCPICRREVQWLKRRDRKENLLLEDIADPAFRADRHGLTQEAVMGAIHGIRSDGSVLRGMAVIREAYRAIGMGWIMAPTGWPIVRPITDWLYRVFARNRLRLGGFFGHGCDGDSCRMKGK